MVTIAEDNDVVTLVNGRVLGRSPKIVHLAYALRGWRHYHWTKDRGNGEETLRRY